VCEQLNRQLQAEKQSNESLRKIADMVGCEPNRQIWRLGSQVTCI
jgi:hypothetical protein